MEQIQTTEEELNSSQLKRLDGMRGLAAIGVAIFFHYIHFKPSSKPFDYGPMKWAFQNGWILVDLFFILSGIIMSFRYEKAIADREVSFVNYFKIRLARLYPLHLLTLILVFLIQAIHFKITGSYPIYANYDLYHFTLNLFFLQKLFFDANFSFNGPSWSVSVEMALYLIFFAASHAVPLIRTSLAAGLALLGLYLTHINDTSSIGRGLLGFFVGMLLHKILLEIKSKRDKWPLHLASILLLLLATIGSISVGSFDAFLGRYYVYSILIFPFVIILSLNYRAIGFLFETRPLTYLGKISYAVYMIHVPIQMLILTIFAALGKELHPEKAKYFLSYAALVLLAGSGLHHFFDQPLRFYLRKRWGVPSGQ